MQLSKSTPDLRYLLQLLHHPLLLSCTLVWCYLLSIPNSQTENSPDKKLDGMNSYGDELSTQRELHKLYGGVFLLFY